MNRLQNFRSERDAGRLNQVKEEIADLRRQKREDEFLDKRDSKRLSNLLKREGALDRRIKNFEHKQNLELSKVSSTKVDCSSKNVQVKSNVSVSNTKNVGINNNRLNAKGKAKSSKRKS